MLFSALTGSGAAGVLGPGQVAGDVHPQELGAPDSLHISTVYVERGLGGLLPPEANNDLLHFVDSQV